MLRKLFRPRLWWVLAVPLWFYLTREVIVKHPGTSSIGRDEFGNPEPFYSSDDTEYHISTEEFEREGKEVIFQYYAVGNRSLVPNRYQVLRFIALGCLVIGCLSVGKELFLNKTTAPTA